MIEQLIAEATECDFKVALEIKKPKSWLKSVSSFSNGIGGTLFFGISDHSYFENVAHDLFQGLSMLFIHCQQEEGHHDQHHTHGGHAVSRRLTEQKEQRYAYKRPGGKADQLPSGQIEHDLGFDFG